ncbi:hypothetical protein PABG_03611 [Paracoccidioides brasiliensis Pb03]|nr:hypothetical protein PABG_03611 [Paracoccidioides brasiliensis Pb03]
MRSLGFLFASATVASVVCSSVLGDPNGPRRAREALDRRQHDSASKATEEFLSKFYLDDSDGFMTTDFGTRISEQISLKAGGSRGPTLLEDFIFRQKLTRFDHERIPERVVHARGIGAHGEFTSYGDWSNITAASFLSAAGKKTPVFVRFSTVAGSRGSADTARDVHGFATRFYTDEGNFDLVGNNIPVFFIQDAIQFPDLIHAVKPRPDSEIPQAATAHDSAWDFFSQQPSALHAVMWVMSGNGIPRSMRHVDGFGVHTFRFLTEDAKVVFVRFRWRNLQGKAALVWEEAQAIAGKNPDYHRKDLWDSISAGRFPEWELDLQLFHEEDLLKHGFDLLDPTKYLSEEMVPFTTVGKMTLNRNPINYFAETEQVGFQPGHVVRGIDFSEDPLLQGRVFSYLDTQLNRHNGPNFEQVPINRPRTEIHNNNRDGTGQMFIHKNKYHYTPNTLNNGNPKQANQTVGKGFFTDPHRTVNGPLVREISQSFMDHWTHPRLFLNSLTAVERQFVIDAVCFQTSNVMSEGVRQNVIFHLNLIDHDLAVKVAQFIGIEIPKPDPTFYHDKKTTRLGTFGTNLNKLDGLQVAVLISGEQKSLDAARQLQALFKKLHSGIDVVIIGPTYNPKAGIVSTYAGADASLYDAIVALEGFPGPKSGLYPPGRPQQLLIDAYRYGKTVGVVGSNGDQIVKSVHDASGMATNNQMPSGAFVSHAADEAFVKKLIEGLYVFKWLDRFHVSPMIKY